MATKVVKLDTVSFTPDGIAVRFKRQTIVDGEVLAEEFHRSTYLPSVSVDEWLEALDADFAKRGFSPIPADDRGTIKSLIGQSAAAAPSTTTKKTKRLR